MDSFFSKTCSRYFNFMIIKLKKTNFHQSSSWHLEIYSSLYKWGWLNQMRSKIVDSTPLNSYYYFFYFSKVLEGKRKHKCDVLGVPPKVKSCWHHRTKSFSKINLLSHHQKGTLEQHENMSQEKCNLLNVKWQGLAQAMIIHHFQVHSSSRTTLSTSQRLALF